MGDDNLPPKKTSRTQTFRAGAGAVILNKKGKVLGLERKDIPRRMATTTRWIERG